MKKAGRHTFSSARLDPIPENVGEMIMVIQLVAVALVYTPRRSYKARVRSSWRLTRWRKLAVSRNTFTFAGRDLRSQEIVQRKESQRR